MSTDTPIAVVSAEPIVASPRTQPASFGREWMVVFRYELKRLLLSVRTLLPMAIYAGFAALTLLAFQNIADRAEVSRLKEGMTPEMFEKGKEEILGKGLSITGWGNEGDAAEILRDHVPVVVVTFFAVASYFLPLLVALVSFDQFSELSTRGARFALLRIRRETYLTGKAAAAAASVFIFLLAMWLVVALWSGFHGAPGEAQYMVKESVRAWLLMCVLALPYLSITAIISSLARPVLAFVGTLGTFIGLSLGATLIGGLLPFLLHRMGLEGAIEPSQKLLLIFPWQHAHKLISRYDPTLISGVIGLLLVAACGYAATLFIVRRRDV